jgi:hypothetical protein
MKFKHFGYPAHFICADRCRFHLATQVGKYIVSTVGAFFPSPEGKMEIIGIDRFFETMVFKCGKICKRADCRCNMPETNGRELDMAGYETAGEAQAGHKKMIKKWTEKQKEAE